MTAKRRKCVQCKAISPTDSGISANVGFLCSRDCQREYSQRNYKKVLDKVKATKEKAIKTRHVKRKKELRTRSQWFALLQKEVNKQILIRDANEPCCTCGATNQSIKYDAGHLFAVGRGGADRRRFDPFNIHKQCSVNCNQYGSGMRLEYEQFIISKYGADKMAWLKNESNFPTLKERFPHWTDIEKEIQRYRKLNSK